MPNKSKLRIRLKPDSPEYWNDNNHRIGYFNYDLDYESSKIYNSTNIQLDADIVIRYIKDELQISLMPYQEKILRNFISLKNEGKELVFVPTRQNGITTIRNCMVIINALYNN